MEVIEGYAAELQKVYDERSAEPMTFMNLLVVFGTDYTEALAADSQGTAEDVEQEHIKSALLKDAPEAKIVTSVEEVYRLEGSGLWVAEPFTEPEPGEPFEVRVWRRIL